MVAIALSSSSPNSLHPFTYTGREIGEAGMLFYRTRFYQTGIGRFASEDPIGFRGGDPHLYRYVAGSPLRYKDPSGFRVDAGPSGGFNPFEGIGRNLCAMGVAWEAKQRASASGIWPWAHCWASCMLIKKCGFSESEGAMFGEAKELADFGACAVNVLGGGSGTSGSCESAYQDTDYEDNAFGRSCPRTENCDVRCGRYLDPNRAAPSPGPFFYGGAPIRIGLWWLFR